MARTLAAMQAGRLRWLAKLKAEGKKVPFGRKKGSRNAPLEERRLAETATRLVRARAALRRANSDSPVKRQEARQRTKIEVQRLLEEHQHQEQRHALRLPPLTGAVLYKVIRGFRQRAAVSVPFDPTPRWPNVRELEDKVRDAEDALERAKAEAVRPENDRLRSV
jgi:hypothetical protein